MKRKRNNGWEQDAFSKFWRGVLSWQRGEIRRLKRNSSKRERRAWRVEKNMCCVCQCGHQHPRSSLPVGQDREECVMCKWCICTASEHSTMPD